MDIIELLFLAAFILFPLLEGLLRRGKDKRGQSGPGTGAPQTQDRHTGQLPESRPRGADGRSGAHGRSGAGGRLEGDPGSGAESPEGLEPATAADMVPDDLWAILTGEQRPRSAPQEPGPEPDLEPEWARGGRWDGPEAEDGTEWTLTDEEEAAVPDHVPADSPYVGAEAYSLETLDHPPVTMERPLPSPEVRHRRFHEMIDEPPVRARRRRSPVVRALRSPASLRQAFVLTEVLGTPKGLE